RPRRPSRFPEVGRLRRFRRQGNPLKLSSRPAARWRREPGPTAKPDRAAKWVPHRSASRLVRDDRFGVQPRRARTARSNSATILVILIIGFTAGPAVSLYGSPTVSPVTAAL